MLATPLFMGIHRRSRRPWSSNFGKSRIVPLDQTTVDALRSFTGTRDGLVERQVPALFVTTRGNRMIYHCVQQTFRRLCDATGIGSQGPNRPHS
jgi:integrase/recombinase XerD